MEEKMYCVICEHSGINKTFICIDSSDGADTGNGQLSVPMNKVDAKNHRDTLNHLYPQNTYKLFKLKFKEN